MLWVVDYELPKTVTALCGPILNEAGVILACGSFLQWEDWKTSTFHCSFLSSSTMNIAAVGTKGTLQVHDFIVPHKERAASFSAGSQTRFREIVTGWVPLPSQHVVTTDLPQKACMVREFPRLVKNIKEGGSKLESKWHNIIRNTQLVLDAVKESIEKGFEPVQVAGA
ncbi:uncharacterized oxidoreductase At4g09670-like [Telopea speciosissima]|uniref:uncharacterized oxidoreductase At4g09670-like n=1 Tax=Telopea speciosissima TaxID=54955 RepID=UPI001CC75D92|nr:uncharacterized oxidoreductase At4g09670-like [Telopea speciosissima]